MREPVEKQKSETHFESASDLPCCQQALTESEMLMLE